MADPNPVSRRTILAAGAAAAGLSLPGVTAHAGDHSTTRVRFTLNAHVLDGGEIDRNSLTTNTFTVHAKATSPVPVPPGDQIFSEYDLDRPVTDVRLDHHGNLVLDLKYGEGQVGGGTLGYLPRSSVISCAGTGSTATGSMSPAAATAAT
jgi:hypothetical protein